MSQILNPSGGGGGGGSSGEHITSFIPSASAVPLTSLTPANVTSIILTPGVWDVSCMTGFTGTNGNNTNPYHTSINSTSATLGTSGLNATQNTLPGISSGDGFLTIPKYTITTLTNLVVYLVAQYDYSLTGIVSAYGNINATKVA